MSQPKKAVALVGATASGKSAVAHQVALALSPLVEIICVDAMTVYKGMDIGTAKPSPEERMEVSYHLLDVVEPDEEFTVAEFQRHARIAASQIWDRGHAVLYVGGTGLYGRAIIDDLAIPKQYPHIRKELEHIAETDLEVLYEELLKEDPLAASRMEPNNARRIIRALEVIRGSGQPFSSFGEGLTDYSKQRVRQVGLSSDSTTSSEAIATRFKGWLQAGLVEEVRGLLAAEKGLSRTARQAVGYKELIAYLEEKATLEECVDEAIAQSRKLARRQRAWFRRDPRIEWFESRGLAVERIIELLTTDLSIVRD